MEYQFKVWHATLVLCLIVGYTASYLVHINHWAAGFTVMIAWLSGMATAALGVKQILEEG